VIACGIFHNKKGFIVTGSPKLLIVNFFSAILIIVWCFAMTHLYWRVFKNYQRITKVEEILGKNISQTMDANA
jgi:hypothetical protein